MEPLFPRSCPVLQGLALRERRTPPTEAQSATEYIDRSLVVLGRQVEGSQASSASKFAVLSDLIISSFEKANADFAKRFDALDEKLEQTTTHLMERISHVHKRCNFIDESLQRHAAEYGALRAHTNNLAARQQNALISRLHQKIIPITIANSMKVDSEWIGPSQWPSTVNDLCILVEHAKGIFVEETSLKSEERLSHDAQNLIFKWIEFYSIDLKTEGVTSSRFSIQQVDESMTCLLMEMGMSWEKMLQIREKYTRASSPLTKGKRGGDDLEKQSVGGRKKGKSREE